MSVSAVGWIRAPNAVVAANPSAARHGGFSISDDDPASASGEVAVAGPTGKTASVSASLMLALQESVTSEIGDRDARRHGQELLAALAELQRALLSDDHGAALGRLLLLVRTTPTATDPELVRAINSIRLRARIELVRADPMADGTRYPGI